MQGRWQKTAALLKEYAPLYIKKTVVPLVLSVAGLSGNIWNFVIGLFLLRWWGKAEKEIEKQAEIADQKEIDNTNIDQYKKDKQEGAPVETLIKDETNLLNGTKPH